MSGASARVAPWGAVLVALSAAGGVAHAGEPAATGASARARPAEHYALHCSGCHGPGGRGTPGTTPSLHGLAALAATPEGRAYLARVPGVAQAPLDDADLAALLDWVLARFSDAAPVRPWSAAEVGRLRDRPLRDPAAARRALAVR